MCVFYFKSIGLLKSWCLKSCSFGVFNQSVRVLQVFVGFKLDMYISPKRSSWFTLFDWFVPWIASHTFCLDKYMSKTINFEWFYLSDLFFFQQTRSRFIGNCIYMIPEAHASNNKLIFPLDSIFFLFWRHSISIKLCQLLCKMMPKLLFPLLFFPMRYGYDWRQLAWLSWTYLQTLGSQHLNLSAWFCSVFHSGDMIFI